MTRIDGRTPDQLRDVRITRGWLDHAEGSVLVEFGKTRVLCAASVTQGVPRWRKGSGLGWVTAEYAMLPRSTNTRSDRESVKGRIGGRTHEISRLVGRSLRAAIDYKALGENTIVLDCDVLQADGGTRTAAITGAYVALADAVVLAAGEGRARLGEPLTSSVAAVSVGHRRRRADARPLLRGGRHGRDRHERRDDRRRRRSSRCRARRRASRSTGRSSTRCSTSRRPAAQRLTAAPAGGPGRSDGPAGPRDPQRAQGRRAGRHPRRGRAGRRAAAAAATTPPRSSRTA